MDPQLWSRVRPLFAGALGRPPGEWPSYLDEVCEGDGELRCEVDALLVAHARESGLFASMGADGDDPVPEPLPGAGRIGPYRLFHLLGRGGMGAVYLAGRADGEYQKRVALKLLRPGFDAPEVARRFRRERQILASLEHPFIARLLDGGTTEEGRPYLVLEYVEGRTLDRYCREEQPALEMRLSLFAAICAAVQYAHQNLIVHRDLKPGNILVTAEGQPKLLDFGISKLLNPELGDGTLLPTALGAQPMTPDYASPEQLRGETITTASDVYALGVLLYELITGQHPFRRPGETRERLLQRMTEEEPTRPSDAVRRLSRAGGPGEPSRPATPTIAARRLSGDLDAIVLKALRQEQRRRYGSVEQLAEDLRRHREGQVVLARKGTRTYRFGKWVRRHRLSVTALAAVLAASLGFAVLMGLQARELERERDRAERERRRAEQVQRLLVDLFEVSDPAHATGETITAREVLDRGVEKLATQLDDQPEVRAGLLRTVGTIYRRLGLYPRAEPLLEQALVLRRSTGEAGGAAVAESLNDLAMLRVDQARYAEAQSLYERALVLRRERFGDRSAPVAETLNELGTLQRRRDRPEAAERLLLQALALRRDLFAPESLEIAATLNNLAVVYAAGGRYEQARPLFEEVLAIRRQRLGPRRIEVADATENLGLLAFAETDLPRAEELCRQSLALRRELSTAGHPTVANSLTNLAVVLNQRGRFSEAAALHRQALEIRRQTYGEQHPMTALSYAGLGVAESGLGHLDVALSLQRQALELRRRLQGEKSTAVASSLDRVADTLARQGELDAALTAAGQALEIRRELLGEENRLTLESSFLLARLLAETGRPQEGERLVRQGLAVIERARPGSWLERAEAESVLGECLLALDRWREAEALLTSSVRSLAALGSDAAPPMRDALERLARLYERTGRRREAGAVRDRLRQAAAQGASWSSGRENGRSG